MTRAFAAAGAFLLIAACALPWLTPNFDEGVYIAQARLLWAGKLPYRDFFYHQTPLYLVLVAPFSALGSWSLIGVRSVSLLSSAVGGLLLHRIVASRFGGRAALLAQALFYLAPLAQYGLLALPNGPMVTCTVFAFFLLLERNRALAAGAVAAVAVFIKPLAAASALALVATALSRGRRTVLLVTTGGVLGGTALMLLTESLSGGGFSDVLALQLGRYGARGGFDVMAGLSEFAIAMEARGATGPIEWSLAEHRDAFLGWGPLNGNLWLLGLALLSPLFRDRDPFRVACGAWLILPILFNLLVWEPAWDHYFLQYVPPLACAAALSVDRALSARPRLVAGLGIAVVAVTVALRPVAPTYLEALREAVQSESRVFSFNPLVHAVTPSSPACGIIDPMNVYGEHCAAALAPASPLSRFRISEAELVRCLADETAILVDRYTFWFASQKLLIWMRDRPERLRFPTPADRLRFEAQTVPAPRGIE